MMRSLLPCLVVGFFVLGSVVAQPLPTAQPDRFEGTNPDPVPFGGVLNVEFDNGTGPQEITVTAYDLADPSDTREISIDVNGEGTGTASFDVPPGWGGVVLTHPTSSDHTVPVDSDAMPLPLRGGGEQDEDPVEVSAREDEDR